MSGRLEPMFERLRGQCPPAPFAPAEAVRRRGRQRARRQAALAGIAVLTVTGAGAGAAAVTGLPGPPPSVGGPAGESPAPAHISTRLLTAADLGPGDWREGWEPEWSEGAVSDVWSWSGRCGGAWTPAIVDQAEVGWTVGPWDDADIPRWVHQVVIVAPPGAGEPIFDRVRGEAECAPDHEIVATGFAGDESMFVRAEILGYFEGEAITPVIGYTAVVRVGEAVATVRGYDPDLGHADPAFLREVAQRAADRLG
jgi:hypothetical protein